MEKYAKDIQGDSPLENPLVKSRATAVRVATLLRRTVLAVALAMRRNFGKGSLSALAMNSGAAGFIAALLPNLRRVSWRSETMPNRHGPSPAALYRGGFQRRERPLVAFANFSAAKSWGPRGLSA